MVPERLVHEAVIQQEPNGARVALPHQLVEQLLVVGVDEPVEEREQQPRLREVAPARELLRVGRIEGKPEEDEASVMIVPLLLGAVKPAQRAVHAQAEGFGKGMAQLALAGLERGVVECEVQVTLLVGGGPSMARARSPSRPGDGPSIRGAGLTG